MGRGGKITMSNQVIAPALAGQILGSIHDSFAVAEWRENPAPPGPPRLVAPWHVHHADDEAWYVLEGVICVQKADQEVEVRAGSGVLVPRGIAHTYWNPAAEPARYLLIMTPTIIGLIEDIDATQDRSRSRLLEVRRNDNHVLLDG